MSPVSKKRKKKGKQVKRGEDRMSSLTLQDLINVVAYQEAHPEEAQSGGAAVIVDETVPVVVGEGENKREIGTASPIPGDKDHLSIHITDPEILEQLEDPPDSYSIDKEQI